MVRTLEHLFGAESPASGRELLCDRTFDLSSVASARAALAEHARARGLTDIDLTKFVLAVHEVMINSVRHGGGGGRLLLWCTADALHCHVDDDGPGIPPSLRNLRRRRPPVGRIGAGHGLWLAGQVCPGVRITDRAGGGAEVCLTYPLPGRGGPDQGAAAPGNCSPPGSGEASASGRR